MVSTREKIKLMRKIGERKRLELRKEETKEENKAQADFKKMINKNLALNATHKKLILLERGFGKQLKDYGKINEYAIYKHKNKNIMTYLDYGYGTKAIHKEYSDKNKKLEELMDNAEIEFITESAKKDTALKGFIKAVEKL